MIGHHFRDRSLMEEALKEIGPASTVNERLALSNEKILALMLLHHWYIKATPQIRLILLQ